MKKLAMGLEATKQKAKESEGGGQDKHEYSADEDPAHVAVSQ